MRSWVAAAALLGAVAAALIGSGVLRRSDTSGTVAGSETERALVASAADLARARPELFGDFLPYSARERRAAGPPLRGGAPAPVYPAGKILEARPAFRWEAGPAPQEDEIVLRTARGDLVWRGRGRAPLLEYPADAPDLQPGVRYVWEIASGGRRVFATASAEERRAFESWRKEIEARVSAPLRTLVLAHLALRREFVGEAERAALAFVASAPGEAVGKETLDLVLQRLGVLGSTGPETRGPGPR